MSDRLRVVKREFTYPVPASLEVVRVAGGMSKLTPEERKSVQVKIVKPGDYCDDMPTESIALRLERGEIERVPDGAPRTFPAAVPVAASVPDPEDASEDHRFDDGRG